MRVGILKNNDGVKLIQLSFCKIKLNKTEELNSNKLILIGEITIEYFNKRKMTFEPLLEPWSFCFK